MFKEEREVAEILGLENSRLHKLEDRLSELEARQLLDPAEDSQGFPGGAFSGFHAPRTGK